MTSTDPRCTYSICLFVPLFVFLLYPPPSVVRRSAESLLESFFCCCRNCNQSQSHDYLLMILGDSTNSLCMSVRICPNKLFFFLPAVLPRILLYSRGNIAVAAVVVRFCTYSLDGWIQQPGLIGWSPILSGAAWSFPSSNVNAYRGSCPTVCFDIHFLRDDV